MLLKRKLLVSLVLVMGINYVPVANAGECSWWDALSAGITCIVKLAINRAGESHGKGLARGIRPEFNEMVGDAGKQLADHINNSVNWDKIGKEIGEGASKKVLKALELIDWKKYGQEIGSGLRGEFEATMDKLFDEKIKPLLKDIDMVLENRLDQADKIAEDRLNQLNSILEDKLKQIDAIIQSAFDQFKITVNDTIKQVRTDVIDYTFTKASEWRDESISKIRTDIIDYANTSFTKTTDAAIAKVRKEIIDHTFDRAEKLRQAFSVDMINFFDKARELIIRLECTEEKTRLDIQNVMSTLDKLGTKYLKEMKDFNPKNWFIKKSGTLEISPNAKCYQEAGIDLNNIDSIEGFEYLTIYEIKKCKVLSTLTITTPVKRISNVYWDLYMFTQRVACFQENTEHFVWDLLELKSAYEYWKAEKLKYSY